MNKITISRIPTNDGYITLTLNKITNSLTTTITSSKHPTITKTTFNQDQKLKELFPTLKADNTTNIDPKIEK